MGYFKIFSEAIDTPPHMPLQFFNEHINAFNYFFDILKIVKTRIGYNFYYFAKNFLYSNERSTIDNIANDLPSWLYKDIEIITNYLNQAIDTKDDGDRQNKFLKRTINENLLKTLEDIDPELIGNSLYKLKIEVESAKNDWDGQEWGNFEDRIKDIELLNQFNDAIKKMKKWYKNYVSKTKAFLDLADRRVAAFYSGKNFDKNIPPQTEKTEILYHATTAVSDILREGFKSRKELGGRSGLGGGPDEVISFTADIQIAESIVWALRRACEVSKGKTTYRQLELLAKKLGVYEESLKGVVSSFGQFETIDDIKNFKLDRKPRIEEQKKEWMFEFFRYIITFQNKIYNPWFAMVSYKNFEKLNINEIGIIAAEIEMDKISEYLVSMEEYRVPVTAIKKIWKVPYGGVLNPVVTYK